MATTGHLDAQPSAGRTPWVLHLGIVITMMLVTVVALVLP